MTSLNGLGAPCAAGGTAAAGSAAGAAVAGTCARTAPDNVIKTQTLKNFIAGKRRDEGNIRANPSLWEYVYEGLEVAWGCRHTRTTDRQQQRNIVVNTGACLPRRMLVWRNGLQFALTIIVLPIQIKTEATASVLSMHLLRQTEKEDPHPQVLVALGFLITNWAPSRPSL